jgi:PAS domain S-box-containing protein
MAAWVRGDGYGVVEFTDWAVVDGAVLRGWDAVIMTLEAWIDSAPVLRKLRAEGNALDPLPAVMVHVPAGVNPWDIAPAGLQDDVSYLMYPVNARHLSFQIRAVLDRRKVITDLRYRLKEREDVLRSVQEVFFSVDHEFRYTFFNEKAQEVGGKTEAEVLGQDMWETFPALRGTEFHRQFLKAAVERQIQSSEYHGPITGGTFEMRIYPSAGGLSALFVDVTARKKAEEDLRQAKLQLQEANSNLESAVAERTAQLREANQRLEEVLYSIAHDLRSPLRSMQGFAQAFVDDYCHVLDDRARQYGQRMTAAAIFMDRMLKDLLELSRITKSEAQVEAVSIEETWKSAVVQHEEAIDKTGAKLEAKGPLGHVAANPILLEQILANLLGNALKFAREGTPPVVKIWTEPIDPQTVAIFVEDNGIGIEERHYDKIFRVFERLNGAEYDGTGIGLAIARKAAERMHGTLDLTSTVGVGTRFRLVLPGQRSP